MDGKLGKKQLKSAIQLALKLYTIRFTAAQAA